MPELSPLAPKTSVALPSVKGIRLGGVACGVKKNGRKDLCLMIFDKGTTVAGVLTRSLTAAAPVLWCKKNLHGGFARALVANAGNSNAFTGKSGAVAVDRTAKLAAKLIGCKPSEVFIASTGVIGEPLPVDRILNALPGLAKSSSATGWDDAAEAILTTDTFRKVATRKVKIGKTPVTINGFAKGSGMIAPDMATMLAFIVTDAVLPASVLRTLLKEGADKSFNCTTVDGDTSTSDTLLAFATGAAADQPKIRNAKDASLSGFRKAFDAILLDLAHQVVRDGEGAKKFITVKVTGAASEAAAKRIALTIANSPLVKTAVAGEDANWGRIVMAVGKAGEKAERDRLRIRIGGVAVAAKGQRVAGYDEAPVAAHMKGQEILIEVDVGANAGKGRGTATVWTCDLTHAYISINADYRS
jgi:glutamate N-acetyltransferase/amino-acid N-acetyltransferase